MRNLGLELNEARTLLVAQGYVDYILVKRGEVFELLERRDNSSQVVPYSRLSDLIVND
jgi:hypothetical protein